MLPNISVKPYADSDGLRYDSLEKTIDDTAIIMLRDINDLI